MNSEPTALPYETIDAHVHITNFIQETKGLHRLAEQMRQTNISKSVIFGMPIIKKWNATEKIAPEYYLDDDAACYYYQRTDEIVAEQYLKLPKALQQRFAPLLCGFNPTDRFSFRYVQEMFEKYPFFRGIGELLFRHDDLTNITMGEVARPNHAAMLPIYQFCGEKNVPVLLHQNSTSIGGQDAFRYMHELEEVLQLYRDTKFVWAHVGISRRIYNENYHIIIDSTLTQNKNLYVDLSWIVYEELICQPDMTPKPEWFELIKKHHEKIMIGSDVIGNFEAIPGIMQKYNTLLQMLPEEAAKNIAYNNANKLWFTERTDTPGSQ
jgi:hypothetical protein